MKRREGNGLTSIRGPRSFTKAGTAHYFCESLGLVQSAEIVGGTGQTNNGLGEEMLGNLNHGVTPQQFSLRTLLSPFRFTRLIMLTHATGVRKYGQT